VDLAQLLRFVELMELQSSKECMAISLSKPVA
jgi:hypothetical protein